MHRIAAAMLRHICNSQLVTRPPLPPAQMQRAMQMKLSMVSPNVLAEPYRGVPPPLRLSAFLGTTGWRELWRRFLAAAKSVYALSKCK